MRILGPIKWKKWACGRFKCRWQRVGAATWLWRAHLGPRLRSSAERVSRPKSARLIVRLSKMPTPTRRTHKQRKFMPNLPSQSQWDSQLRSFFWRSNRARNQIWPNWGSGRGGASTPTTTEVRIRGEFWAKWVEKWLISTNLHVLYINLQFFML